MAIDMSCAWTSRGTARVVGAHCTHETQGHLLVTASDQVVRCNTAKMASGVAVQVQSWDFRAESAQAITVPAVANKDVYYAVRGKAKNELISWTKNTEKLANLEAIKIGGSVHQLLVHPQLDGVVVIGSTGSIQIYASKLDKLIAEPKGKTKPNVVFAALDADKSKQLYLAIVTKSNTYEAAIYKFDDLALTLVRKDTIDNENDLISAVYHPKDCSFSMLWSSGLWQSVSEDGTKDLTTLTSAEVTENKRRKVNSVSYQTCEVAPKTVAIASKSNIGLWDSKFGVRHSNYELSTEQNHGALIALFKFPGSHVALVFEKAVLFTIIEAQPSTLASVLGKGSNTLGHKFLLSTNVTKADAAIVAPTLEVQTWQEKMLIGNEEQKKVLEKLTSPKLTPTQEAFTEVFNTYVYNKSKSKIRGVLSPLFVHQVAERCLNSAEIGLWRELKVLIKSRHLCSRTLPTLIPTLIKHKQFGLLDTCLTSLSDIDEAMNIRICKFILRHANAKSVALYQVQSTNKNIKTPAELVEHFLHLIVALPKTDVFLQNALRQLKLADVIALLRCLKKWYAKDDANLPAIVEWIGLIMDVHFTNLVLASESHPDSIVQVIKNMQQILAQHLDACTFMADIHGELDQFLSGSHLPQTGSVPDYSVETLML
ncbi:hypothetical protein THRCLA_07151 [Thraustotheca clavata]|uniref:Uncharacterized protein n=1 Tax=Thraustotheca clavata TaxID=74557 RepID=A0A1V9ZFS8_9STRA|nr:hypothetical protein THRCLA_07151 [Thraustotheca clavata]